MTSEAPEEEPKTTSGTGNEAKVGEKERYAATIGFISASEATSVSRFNAFLVFSAILAAGWVQLATRSDSYGGKLTMSLLCLFGVFAGVVWAGIGGRSRSYIELYRKIGERLEKSGDKDVKGEYAPCTGAARFEAVSKYTIRKRMEEHSGASKLFFFVPLAVSVLFLILGVLPWFYPVLSSSSDKANTNSTTLQSSTTSGDVRQPPRGSEPSKR